MLFQVNCSQTVVSSRLSVLFLTVSFSVSVLSQPTALAPAKVCFRVSQLSVMFWCSYQFIVSQTTAVVSLPLL